MQYEVFKTVFDAFHIDCSLCKPKLDCHGVKEPLEELTLTLTELWDDQIYGYRSILFLIKSYQKEFALWVWKDIHRVLG